MISDVFLELRLQKTSVFDQYYASVMLVLVPDPVPDYTGKVPM